MRILDLKPVAKLRDLYGNYSGVVAPFAILGCAALGYWLIQWRSGRDDESAEFAASSAFDIWSLLMAGLFGLAVTIFMMVLPYVVALHRKSVPQQLHPAVPIFLTYLLFGITAVVVPDFVNTGADVPLYKFEVRIGLAYFFVAVFAFAPALGIGYIRYQLTAWRNEWKLAPSSHKDRLTKLTESRDTLQRLLISFTLIISGAVLTTGALRGALIAYDPDLKTQVTPESVYLFGGFYTALLAVAYIPTFLAWRSLAADLVSDAFPIPEDGKPSQEWQAERAVLVQVLKLDVGAGANLTTAFGILAPLASGIITALIGSTK